MTMLKDTIISAFNYDGTLLKWLKKVQEALENASASEFRVNKKGNATISFSIVFANGDTLESGDIILQQGESVTNATIRQGHLILTLSNGDELDAGDLGAVTGFAINASQHLIVTYQNGTTQDLGAIFTGNVNINGNLAVTGNISDLSKIVDSQGRKRFVEGSIATISGDNSDKFTLQYSKWSLSGTHLQFVIGGYINTASTINHSGVFFEFILPDWIRNKLQIITPSGNRITWNNFKLYDASYNEVSATFALGKFPYSISIFNIGSITTTATETYFRIGFDLLIDTD